jgi:hypothetical protein
MKMILAKIEAQKHPGCWASESTSNQPTHIIHLCLAGQPSPIGYRTHAIFIPKEKTNQRSLSKILGTINRQQMVNQITLVQARTGANPYPLFSIDVQDLGFTRGLIRAVIEEKNARLPPLQQMVVEEGKETIYAVFRDINALTRVQIKLGTAVGSGLISFDIINENCTALEAYNLIPSFFDDLVPQELSFTIKNVLGGLAEGSLKFEEACSIVNNAKHFLENWGWLLALAIDGIELFQKVRPFLGG